MKDLKRSLWSVEEDEKLISYIKRYGIWNWSQMPKFAGLSRSGKSCRLRWNNHLKPNLKRGEFTKEEEESILHFHSLLGNKWSAIASRLPGRTDNDIKNYWHSRLRKSVSEQNLESQTTEQNDNSSSPPFEETQQLGDHNDVFESNFSFENNIVSSQCTTTSMDPGVDFRANYNDICGSPGTFDDLQCFWDQLCPFENLELRNINHHMDVFPNHICEDPDNDPISSYIMYDNDYNYDLLFYP